MHDAKNPRLILDPRFTHLVRAGDRAVLVGEDDFLIPRDPLVEAVVRLVDGTRSAVEIARALAARRRPEVVHYVLLLLEEEGVLRPEKGPGAPAPLPAPAERDGVGGRLAQAWWSRDEGAPCVRAPTVEQDLGTALILAEDYLHPGVAELVRATLRDGGGPLLLARPGARGVWIGPRLGGDGAPCVSCLQARLRMNLPARTLLYRDGKLADDVEVVPLARTIPRSAFEAIDRQLGVGDAVDAFRATLRSVSLGDADPVDHHVPALPQCPECGAPDLTVPGTDVRLKSRRKVAGSGGGFRTVTPDETLHRVSGMVDPLTGVVRSVRRIPAGGCASVHVYSASHAHHWGRARLADLGEETRDHSGGKGSTDLDARVSAVCESLERASSIHRGDEPTRRARLSELGPAAVAPAEVMGFSERQLEGRRAWNRKVGEGFQWISEPYGDEEIEWSPARSLQTSEVRWVPSAFVYYAFAGEGSRFCDGDSNGLASGNCVEEAVLQGLLEVVERDAVALWWYNRAPRPRAELPVSEDTWLREVEACHAAHGRTVWALDLTSDVGLPVRAALSARDGREIVFGFGAHLDSRIALRRAVCEANQMLTAALLPPEERRAALGRDFPDVLAWWEDHTLESDSFLEGARTRSVDRAADPPFRAGEDLRDDVRECVARVASTGCDVLVHDLTRPDVDFPVVKTIVPGFRHFWRRLGPGRLYDVPVRLGWVGERVAEEEMNPVSLFV